MDRFLASAIFDPARRRPRGLVFRLFALIELRRQRRALSELDEARLDDMGIDREQALAEAARPIWDAPANWMR